MGKEKGMFINILLRSHYTYIHSGSFRSTSLENGMRTPKRVKDCIYLYIYRKSNNIFISKRVPVNNIINIIRYIYN